ncbi:hypothetical protein Tco_0608928 [Tanacetum coccineum]
MKCFNCQGVGHNKASCDKEAVPKPPIVKRPIGRRREEDLQPASARGGRGSRGSGISSIATDKGDMGGRNGDMVVAVVIWVVAEDQEVVAEDQEMVAEDQEAVAKDQEVVAEGDHYRQNIEHEYLQGLLDEEEEKRQKEEKEYQEKLDKEAFRQAMEEEAMFERIDLERARQEEEWDALNDYRFPEEDESIDVDTFNKTKASINFNLNTQESIIHVEAASSII